MHHLLVGQFWQLNGTELINQDGQWTSNSTWQLPAEGSTGYVRNMDTTLVLGIANDGTIMEVEEEMGQKYKRGATNNEGYFVLTNSDGKRLAATSEGTLTIEGEFNMTLIQLKISYFSLYSISC